MVLVKLHTKHFSSDNGENPYPGILSIEGYICTGLQNKSLNKPSQDVLSMNGYLVLMVTYICTGLL